MKISKQLVTGVIAIGVLLLALARSSAETAEPIPQAQPVIALLKAVKEGDQKQLQTAFSEKVRAQYDKEGWDNVLPRYQEGFKTAFGDYKLEDFTFEYKGTEEQGAVSIVYKGKSLPGLAVTKEKAEWKLNER